jgi:serine/threonine protein kinase
MSQHIPAALPQGGVFLGRYEIVRCINAGGMGAVYECIHVTTRKRRALKVMLPHVVARSGMRERFELEARVTAEIDSDHIVETFDAGVDEATGAPYLVMELLRGDDLKSILERCGPFNGPEAVVLLSQVALALDRTHAAGIIHRDLKPDNLFLTIRDDGSPRLKILDFGIAKVVADGAKAAKQTEAIGTPVYMSPEQITGDGTIGPPADLYALAHIAYALLVGEAYWREEASSLPMYAFLGRVLAGPEEPACTRARRRGVSLPPVFDAWFARATAPSPGDRFDRASTQIAELSTALGAWAPRVHDRENPQTSFTGLLRVLAPRPSAPSSPSHPDGVLQTLDASALAAPREGSADAVTLRLSSSRAPRAALAVAAILAAALGVFGVARALGGPNGDHAATTEIAPVPPAPTVTPESEGGAQAAPAPTTPVMTASDALPPAAAPSVEPTGSAAHTPPSRAGSARTKPPETAAPTRGCDPPYVVDKDGHRHIKPQCQ